MDIKYWAHRIMLQARKLEEEQEAEQLEVEFISIDELNLEEEEDMPFSDRYTPIDQLLKRWPDYEN